MLPPMLDHFHNQTLTGLAELNQGWAVLPVPGQRVTGALPHRPPRLRRPEVAG
jgi:hypothetical protein